jgi:hypothetical protein
MSRRLIPGTIWKIPCHNLFITYFTFTFFKHWLSYYRKDFGTDKLRKSCLCSTCKYFCFESGFKKISNNMSICTMTLESVGKIYPRRSHWMEIPIQHDVYIWADYSFSSYLNFIPIFWNVLIWLKYDLLNIFTHLFPCTLTYTLWDHCADTGSWIRGKIRIFEGKYWYFEGIYGYLPSGQVINTDLAIIGHGKTNILQQNMW